MHSSLVPYRCSAAEFHATSESEGRYLAAAIAVAMKGQVDAWLGFAVFGTSLIGVTPRNQKATWSPKPDHGPRIVVLATMSNWLLKQ